MQAIDPIDALQIVLVFIKPSLI
jgi:hypothetical protein